MGEIVAGGSVGYSADVLAAAGVEDHTDQFRETPEKGKGVFSGIVGQDRAIREFVESLSLDMLGRMNLGDAGLGKSATTTALINALRQLDRGEELEGEYAEEVTAFYRQLKERPRGDVIALWNPRDYRSPIIHRADVNGGDRTFGEELGEDLDGWVHGLKRAGLEVAIDSAAHYEAANAIGEKYAAELKMPERGDLENIVANLSLRYPRESVESGIDVVLEAGEAIFDDISGYWEDVNKVYWDRLESVIERGLELLIETSDEWLERDPVISRWYRDVAGFIKKPKHTDRLIKGFLEMSTAFAYDASKESDDKPTRVSLDVSAQFIRIEPAGDDLELHPLLEPAILYSEDDADVLVIREPSIVDGGEFFGTIIGNKSETLPLHHQIELGVLAYADIVVIDDASANLLSDSIARQAFLTYLNPGIDSGEIRFVTEGRNLQFKNQCLLFANESQDPFFRQVFKGTKPQYDPGMARRFNTVEWASATDADEASVRGFPHIVGAARDKAATNLRQELTIEPEAVNLLYHHLIAPYDRQELFPLNVGAYGLTLQKAFIHCGKDGVVTAEGIKDFLRSEAKELRERIFVRESLASMPAQWSERMVGNAMGLAVAGGVGLTFPLSAYTTDRLGRIGSHDLDAQLGNEAFHKGVLTIDSWLHSQFGPFSAEVEMRLHSDTKIEGNSATAVQNYTAMSALGDIPIRQDIYVTGALVDRQGTIGSIGGAYHKSRGAMLFHDAFNERVLDREPTPLTVLIPPQDACGLLRRAQFDDQMMTALESGHMTIKTHETTWDGFETMSGLPREEYEPRIRENIARVEQQIARHEYSLRHPILAKLLQF